MAPRLLLALLVMAASWQAARFVWSADGPAFKSSTVRSARSALMTALAAASREFVAKHESAQKKYKEALETAQRQATKDGDLDEANRLDLELKLATDAPLAGGVPTLTGTWKLRWTQQAYTDYTFTADGDVHRVLKDAPLNGVLRRLGNDLVVDFGNQSLMRVNLAGPRLVLEYWNSQADFPAKYPDQFGIGERVP